MKNNINEIRDSVKEKGKSIAGVLGKAKDAVVTAIDQNDDGEFNLKDISSIADTIGNVAKNTANTVKEGAEAKQLELEYKLYKPIFPEDLDDAEFLMPKLIRITEMDRKRAASDACKGSIGYYSTENELSIINIFRNSIEKFGISLIPNIDNEIYYIDPSDRDSYICLDDYFNYLKLARVSELQKIAQDLGAKHFKVIFKEQKKSFSKGGAKAKAKSGISKKKDDSEYEHDIQNNDTASIEIAAEMSFVGHFPREPKLKYLQREQVILDLIEMRMNETSPITQQHLSLKLSNSSGMKVKDAMKIDAALKALKLSGNATVASEAQSEDRRYFEYEIDF